MTTLFISDLHLDAARPDITALFCRFVEEQAAGAAALYILGDLFEAWIGDDAPGEVGDTVASALRGLAAGGVPCSFLHGNRDFLLGRDYADRAGFRLLPDPSVIVLGNEAVLLSHGDQLCTGDSAYQAFRRQTRDPAWRAAFLAQPLDARLAFAAQARAASAEHQRALMAASAPGPGANAAPGKSDTADIVAAAPGEPHVTDVITGAPAPDVANAAPAAVDITNAAPAVVDITDVAADAVTATFRRYGVRRMIHGHTHRPAIHALQVDGRDCERIVLGDWYTQGSVLRIATDGSADLASLS